VDVMSKNEKQVLLNLRGKVVKSFDGLTTTTVLWTDTKTGQVELPREKLSLTSFLLEYVVPEGVY
jgi:hypothetical protein